MKKKQKITLIVVILLLIFFSFLLLFSNKKNLTNYLEKLKENGAEVVPVTVAVIDSGWKDTGKYQGRISGKGYNFVEKTEDVTDEYGHGTEVISLILENTPNTVSVMPLKVTEKEGTADIELVKQAMEYAANQGADIIHVSLNGILQGEEDRFMPLIKKLKEQGILVIVSAGNTGTSVQNLTPANVEDAIVVAALNKEKAPCDFSGYGETVDFCSFGKYNGEWGTSFAAGYVTAAIAQLKTYGVENAEQVLRKTAQPYDSDTHLYGKGYVWIDSFTSGKKSESEGWLYIGNTQKVASNLGLKILELNWKKTTGEKLDQYFGNTNAEYVGLFLNQLSPEELETLKQRCSILTSEVQISSFDYDETMEDYILQEKQSVPFIEYCLKSYEKISGKMLMSADSKWLIENDAAIFYISSADSMNSNVRTSTYKFEIIGLTGQEAGADREPDTNGLTVVKIKIKPDNSFDPEFSSLHNYLTGVTSRFVEYKNGNEVYLSKENKEYSRKNGADNGLRFYGISIKFTNVVNTKPGYHFAEEGIRSYIYGTEKPAMHYHYAILKDDGFYYVSNKKEADTYALASHFKKLSDSLTLTTYTGTEEECLVYDYSHNPLLLSQEEAQKYYTVNTYNNVYLLTDKTSFENGEMMLSGPYYDFSSLAYRDEVTGSLAIENDIAEYILSPVPNNYSVTLDANWGKLKDYENGNTLVDTKNIQTTFDTTNFNNIAWAEPEREGYLFEGWFIDPSDPDNSEGKGVGRNGGVMVWNENGKFAIGNFWNNSGTWKADENAVAFAHWRAKTTLNANGGTFYNYETNKRVTSMYLDTIPDNTKHNNINWTAPTKDGYIFNGWWTSSTNGQGTQIWDKNGQYVAFNGYWSEDGKWLYDNVNTGLKVYAQWIPESRVTADANWGLLSDYIQGNGQTNTTFFETKYGTNLYDNIGGLSPSRDGFVFMGWFADADDPDNSEGKDVGRNGGVMVWDASGKAQKGTDFWDSDGNWNYKDGNVVVFAHWRNPVTEPETYTAYFNANGGTLYDYYWTKSWKDTFYCYTEIGKNYFDNVSSLTPKWEGHTFLGWYNAVTGGKQVYSASGTATNEGTYYKNNLWQYQGNPTFYAHWSVLTYNIKYNGNGGTGSKTGINNLEYGKIYTLSKNNPSNDGFSKTGYVFTGWNTKADGSGTSYSDGGTISYKPSSSGTTLTLYAQWQPYTYNIKYNSNGGSGTRPNTTNLTYGTSYTLSKNSPSSNGFSRTGYAFTGWNTKADGSGTSYSDGGTISYKPSSNGTTLTLYAQWQIYTYNIKYNGNGGSGSKADVTNLKYGTSYTLSKNNPSSDGFSRTGYVFAGWNTKADGSGTSYSDGSTISYKPTSSGTTLTLYAQWQIYTYNIQYNSNGGSGTRPNTNNLVYGTSYTLSKNSPSSNGFSRTGYAFTGWNTKADGSGTSYSDGATISYKPSSNGTTLTLYAQWEIYTYTIKYNGNGGSGTRSNTTNLTYGTSYTLSKNNPPSDGFSRTGYTFTGWNTQADGSGTSYSDGGTISYKPSSSGTTLTLYAQWEIYTYNIKYNGNGGSGSKTGISNLKYGTSYTLSKNNPPSDGFSRTGYTFTGWNTKADGSGTSYNNGGTISYKPSSTGTTLTLYAQWRVHTYTIQFDGNGADGGSMTTQKNLKYDTSYTLTKNSFTKTGYTFTGWNTKADGSGTSYSDGQTIKGLTATDGATVPLYAQWKAHTYTIQFNGNGADSGSMSNLNCTYDVQFTLPTCKFKKTGYIFDGWSLKADGTGTRYADGQKNLKNLTATDKAVVTLYACWKDVTPPDISNETTMETAPGSTETNLIYGWTNKNVILKFSATDLGSGMKSLTLYSGTGTSGNIVKTSSSQVQYTMSQDGIFYFTLVATDKSGNTTTIYITTKIDHITPKGDVNISYDGYRMDISVKNIVEENTKYPDNEASGCQEAWAVLKGVDGDGNVLCEKEVSLTLKTPENIFTGAAYNGTFDLEDTFNYTSEYIQVAAYVKDYAGNYLPASETQTVPAFTLTGYVERCLGTAESWKRGEAGNVHVFTGAFVDSVKIEYPQKWIDLDDTLADHVYDYTGNKALEKTETDLFYIPLYTEDGKYTIKVHAYKNGHEKVIELPVSSSGTILDEIRTRLR